MTVKSGQVWTGNFDTLDATGAAAVPSVGPVGTLYVDGVANGAAVTISGGAPYKFSVTLPVLTPGQSVGMRITATISLIATASFVAWDDADTKLNSDPVTLEATQGAITWAQQKIVANVANEGALDIRNANAAGHGTLNDGGNVGLYNSGANTGQYNFGTADYGIQAGGGTADIFGDITGDLTGDIIGNLDGTIDGLTADAMADFFDIDSGETSATAIDGSVVKEIMDGLCTPTVFPAGAINFTYTVTDSVTTLPIEGVEVWISTDNPAVNIVWKGDTDAFGVARDVNGDLPALDAGVYFFWCQKVGYTFTVDTEVVS